MIKKALTISVLLFTLAVALDGCISGTATLSKVWFFTYTDELSASDTRAGEAEGNRYLNKLALNPSHFLSLQADGNYTMDFGNFEFGKWVFKKGLIELTDNSGQLKKIQFRLKQSKELAIHVPGKNGTATVWHFEGWPAAKDGNPFSLENNQWRLKATHKENEAAIVQRLHNHFRYWERYFNWGMEVKKSSLDVRSLPGPLKIYGNGFQLIPYQEWPQAWLSRFYDEEDSRMAYDKMKYFLQHDNIVWANTDNKFKMFISAFQQLQQKVH
jgi:hypothetical protein